MKWIISSTTCPCTVSFTNVATFARAIDTLMRIRAEIILVGSALYCHRMLQHGR